MAPAMYPVENEINAEQKQQESDHIHFDGIDQAIVIRKSNLGFMLEMTIEARKAAIAPGLEVRRILPFRLKRMVGHHRHTLQMVPRQRLASRRQRV